MTNDTRSPQWGLWATIGWAVLIAAVFVLLQLATLVGLAALGYVGADASDASGTLIAWSSLVTGIVCTALIAGIVKLKQGASLPDSLRLMPVSARTMFKWLAVTLALIAIADFVTAWTGRPTVPVFMQQAYATAEPLALFWIALVIAAPLFEETFFRGFVFGGLQSSALGATGAIVVTAAVWAAIHLQYEAYEISVIFILGLALGSARVVTRSLLVPFAMHATMNLVATVQTALIVAR